MARRPFNLARSQQIPLAGGPVSWDLRSLPLTMDGKPAHVAAFIVELDTAFVQTDPAPAIIGADRNLLVDRITVARTAARVRRNLSGHSNRILNAVKNCGDEVYPLQADIPATSGSNVSTQVSWKVPILFEHPMSKKKDDEMWPTGAYIADGYVKVNFANVSAAMDPSITLDPSGTNTANLLVILETHDELHFGVDSEAFNIDDSATGSTSTQFDAGDYQHFVFAPEAFGSGGADDVTLVTSFDGGTYQPTALPPLAATDWRDIYLIESKQGDASDNVVATNQAVPLAWVSRRGKRTQPLRASVPFRVTTTIPSGSLAKGHRYIMSRDLARDAREKATIVAAYGLPLSKASDVSNGAEGRRVQQKNAKHVGEKVVIGKVPAHRGKRPNVATFAA